MLGDNIKKRRNELNYTQDDIIDKVKENKSDSLSFSKKQLSNWENGSAIPSVYNLCDLAKVLKTTVDSLLSGSDYDIYNEFITDFNALAGNKHDKYDLFIDFIRMGGLAYIQAMELNGDKKENREKEFKIIEDKYTKEEFNELAKLLSDLTLIAEAKSEVVDVIGELIGKLDISSDKTLKFYQDWAKSLIIAETTFVDYEKAIKEQGYISVYDPSCGVGSTALAAAHFLKNKGVNYQKELYVEVWDTDLDRIYATLIQLTLYGIPAKVIWGNSLKKEIKESFYTVMYFYGGWSFRIK